MRIKKRVVPFLCKVKKGFKSTFKKAEHMKK
jgi:hypothetical protein